MRHATGLEHHKASLQNRILFDELDDHFLEMREAATKEVALRDAQYRETLAALNLQHQSHLEGRRERKEQAARMVDGLADVAASNWAIEAAVNHWGARSDWQLDQVRDLLGQMNGWLGDLVNYLRRPNETKSREKWEDAQNAWQDRRLNRAVELYQEALTIYDALSPASFQLGNLQFFELNNPAEAIEAYRLTIDTATRRTPQLAALAHYNLHVVLRKQGAFEQAWDELVQACALSPGLAPAWWDRATLGVTLEKGRETVLSDLKRAVAIDPLYWHRATTERCWASYDGNVSLYLQGIFSEVTAQQRSAYERAERYFQQIQDRMTKVPRNRQRMILSRLGTNQQRFQSIKASIDTTSYPQLLVVPEAINRLLASASEEIVQAGQEARSEIKKEKEEYEGQKHDNELLAEIPNSGWDTANTVIEGIGVLWLVLVFAGTVYGFYFGGDDKPGPIWAFLLFVIVAAIALVVGGIVALVVLLLPAYLVEKEATRVRENRLWAIKFDKKSALQEEAKLIDDVLSAARLGSA